MVVNGSILMAQKPIVAAVAEQPVGLRRADDRVGLRVTALGDGGGAGGEREREQRDEDGVRRDATRTWHRGDLPA